MLLPEPEGPTSAVTVPGSRARSTSCRTHAPLRRLGRPDDIVGVTTFLASRGAAYLTGLVLPVDGGLTTTG